MVRRTDRRNVAPRHSTWFQFAPYYREMAQPKLSANCRSSKLPQGFRFRGVDWPADNPSWHNSCFSPEPVGRKFAPAQGGYKLTKSVCYESRCQRGVGDDFIGTKQERREMKTAFTTLRAIAPAVVAATAIIIAGCSETTTRKDVADAQKDLDEARQDTQETVREGRQDIAAAQKDTR